MGKLNRADFIQNIIEARQKLDYTQYSDFLETAPIYITLYHQNDIKTTTDEGFRNVDSFIGGNSSVRYDKITGMPLYNVSMAQLELNMDETGLKPGFTTSGTMLPNTVMPIANDYLTIDYMDKQYLFKITEINTDTIKSNNYFKIDFKFDQISDGSIENQVNDNYKVIIDNIGTQLKTVVEEDIYNKVEELGQLMDTYKQNYIQTFLVNEVSSFIYPYQSPTIKYHIYNKYLTEFCIKHNLFKADKTWNSLILDLQVKRHNTFNQEYNTSIFRCVETGSKSSLTVARNIGTPMYINNMDSIFFRKQTRYYDISLTPAPLGMFSFELMPQALIESIMNNIPYEGEGNIVKIKNIIIKYFNDELLEPSDFDALLIDPTIEYDSEFLILIPILMFIIRKIINNNLIQIIN